MMVKLKASRLDLLSYHLILFLMEQHGLKFRANLLSVSKLTQALKCNVTFYPDICVVQDVPFTFKQIYL